MRIALRLLVAVAFLNVLSSSLLQSQETARETPKKAPSAVETHAAAKAAAGIIPGKAADKKLLESWMSLLEERRGKELAAEIEKHLRADDPLRKGGSFAVLFDFFHHLDQHPREAVLVYADFNVAFAMMNMVMRNEERIGRFAHYLLYATLPSPEAPSRRLLYGYLPLFLQFHEGRFPDLREALFEDIDRQLSLRKMSLRVVFDAMPRVGYFPEIEKVQKLLLGSESLRDAQIVLEHLVWRDDDDAALVVSRYIEKLQDYRRPRAEIAMGALVRITSDTAQRGFALLMSGRIAETVGPATRVYIPVRRAFSAAFRAPPLPHASHSVAPQLSFLPTPPRPDAHIVEALATKHIGELTTPEVVRHLQARYKSLKQK